MNTKKTIKFLLASAILGGLPAQAATEINYWLRDNNQLPSYQACAQAFENKTSTRHLSKLLFAGSVFYQHFRAGGDRNQLEAVEPGSKRDAYFDLTRSKSIDALIVLNCNSEDEGLVRLIECNFPVVLFGSIRHPKENSIRSNSSRAVGHVIRHLAELGHQRIAHITYAPVRYVGANERLAAYKTT